MFEYRWATPADILAYFGKPHEYSMQAIVVLENGEPVALGGVYYCAGCVVAFTEAKKPVSKRVVVKALRLFREMIGTKPCRILAQPAKLDTAPAFLRHCGFKPIMNELYAYGG